MAESQLQCMEDGRIPAPVPESRPEFYYSEAQRAAVETLLRRGDGAFKTQLEEDDVRDFLSAREIKRIVGDFEEYKDGETTPGPSASAPPSPGREGGRGSGPHSTYWPQVSEHGPPPLDLGWPGAVLFRGVARVAVHTHPPKDGGPHVKEVVRRLIQEASKVIAVVMDLLTDLQILQDLMKAAWRRAVPVYLLLDLRGVPHFLDMFSRLKPSSLHLRNIRTRTLQGAGLGLSFGRLPGSLRYKYMIVDGDKVAFGSYSFSWCTSRIDRNMITVLSGQAVDTFDRDFRELYAVSEDLDLYKELHVAPPPLREPPVRPPAVAPKRPPLPATTSRFQVSLGDAARGGLQVPAHKYYNPKYFLAFGEPPPRPPGSLHEPMGGKEAEQSHAELRRLRSSSSERLDRLSPLPSDGPLAGPVRHVQAEDEKPRPTLRQRLFGKWTGKSVANSRCPSPTSTEAGEGEDGPPPPPPPGLRASKWRKKSSKMGPKSDSMQTISTTQDTQSTKSRRRLKASCAPS